MFYFLSVFVIFMLFLIFQQNRRISVKYLVSTGCAYMLAIFSMLVYLSKDVLYYNVIDSYFLLPRFLWRSFMFLPVSRNNLLRLMNLFSLAVLFLGCLFSLSYRGRRRRDQIPRLIFFILTAELLLYDPFIEKHLYLLLCPHFLNLGQYGLFLRVTHLATLIFNHLLAILSILNLFQANRQIYSFPYLKYFAFGETFSYTLIMVSYLILFGQLPNHMIRYSRISGYTSYVSLPLYDNKTLYILFPYYLFFASVLMGCSILLLAWFNKRINQSDFTISSQIDAANTTSKTFCHYMKNELLALQAQTQLLEVSPESRDEQEQILKRFQTLYTRLDTIHRSTKNSQLILESASLEDLIRRMTERMAFDLKDCQVEIVKTGEVPPVLIDPDYFEQALQNIVTNAVEVMRTQPETQRRLTFSLRSIDYWVALSVTDTGPGIPQDHLPHIFDPFFSSRPIAEHWGIGLTQTYRIIKAHKGRISVESKEGRGTTFRILLPNLNRIL